jgi:hypothetical protein
MTRTLFNEPVSNKDGGQHRYIKGRTKKNIFRKEEDGVFGREITKPLGP